MSRQHKRLADLALRRAKPGKRLCDGDGLYFYATGPGRGSWVLRYKWDSRDRYAGLGSYPSVSIATAREKAEIARRGIANGIDPLAVGDDNTLDAKTQFRIWAKEFFNEQTWPEVYRNAQERRLEMYVYPIIGDTAISDIETQTIWREILSPLWKSKTPTAKSIQNLMERIWDFAAVLTELKKSNPARWKGTLSRVLASPTAVHETVSRVSVPYQDIAPFYARVRKGSSVSHFAIAIIILTGLRSRMALQARRAEVDLDAKIWTIPKERVKGMRQEFRVPLSDTVIELLEKLNIRALGPNDPIFPGRVPGRPVHHLAVLYCLQHMKRELTVHGFRATLRTWGFEHEDDFRQDIVEMSLAHTLSVAKASGVSSVAVWKAYQRGDALAKRRVLMDTWALFVTGKQERNVSVAITHATYAPVYNYEMFWVNEPKTSVRLNLAKS